MLAPGEVAVCKHEESGPRLRLGDGNHRLVSKLPLNEADDCLWIEAGVESSLNGLPQAVAC